MPDIISFEQAISDTEGQDRTLLLGNGFSINYFNYGSLLEASGIQDGSPLKNLFARLDTKDFELVMRSLEDAAIVEEVYGNNAQAKTFNDDASALREGLIHAINETHPSIKNELDEIIPSCSEFISNYECIFTLNYDLLLYWVQLENKSNFRDGFGLGKRTGTFQGPFKNNAYCNIYNPHGGLHLFQTSWDEVKKIVATANTIIDAITETIRRHKKLPLYVAEGTSSKKMAKINSVPYLKYCLETLEETAGNIFVYGHSASENDEHIYRAIFRSEIEKIIFCVHRPTADVNSINGELQRYKAKYRPAREIEIIFVDSETVHVWDAVIEDEEDEQ